jgi:hypothetical protein
MWVATNSAESRAIINVGCIGISFDRDLSLSHDLFGGELNDFLHRLGRDGLTLGEGADA